MKYSASPEQEIPNQEKEKRTPSAKDVLTEAGARLMALGASKPYRGNAYRVRLYN